MNPVTATPNHSTEGKDMKSSMQEINPLLGTLMDGGYYAGRIRIEGQLFALIIPPKAESEHTAIWIPNYKDVPGAKSYNDGLANTQAMADAGSKIAKKAMDLGMYIPSLDELEIAYRNLKPSSRQNYCYARSGINLNAIEPTTPHTPEFPTQTQADLFKEGAEQAFSQEMYWTSTQHASASDYAWCQYFSYGLQDTYSKGLKLRVRFFRRLPI